jgi:hypothetical protein
MTDEQSEYVNEEEFQPGVSKSHDHFNPVVVTDTVGAIFLGAISLILMAVVSGLLIYVRKLEDQLRKPDQSIE